MTDQDPYTAPEASPLGVVVLCPKCGEAMQGGNLRSSSRIFWAHDQASRIKNLFFGGEPIGPVKSGLGCKHEARHCPDCRLYLLSE